MFKRERKFKFIMKRKTASIKSGNICTGKIINVHTHTHLTCNISRKKVPLTTNEVKKSNFCKEIRKI